MGHGRTPSLIDDRGGRRRRRLADPSVTANALHLLDEFEKVTIPETVLEEVGDHVLDAIADVAHTVELVEHSNDEYPTLDSGETAAIILASENESVRLTDDLAARELPPSSTSRSTDRSVSFSTDTIAAN